MQFREIELSDRAQVEKCAEAAGCMSCDASFVNMFIYKGLYPSKYCIADGFVFRREPGPEGAEYSFPLGGGDIEAALAAVVADAGGRPSFTGLTEEQRGVLAECLPAMKYDFAEQRGIADYIYSARDLIDLSGKKYHAKRNFINRFELDYGSRCELVPIGSSNFDEVWKFNKAWCEREGCPHEGGSIVGEACAIRAALAHYIELGLMGLVLRLDGRIIAYTIGSRLLSNVADVHIEKADDEIPGAYPMINHSFVSQTLSGFEYINREEDMDVPGLRRAKESYHPAILLMRYKTV